MEQYQNFESVRNFKDSYEVKFPLHQAIINRNIEIAKSLITLENCNQIDDAGKTPLAWAITIGSYELFTYLIEKGAKYDFVNSKNGDTALHYCLRYFKTVPNDFQKIFDYLIKFRPRFANENTKKETILHLAADKPNPEIIGSIIKANASGLMGRQLISAHAVDNNGQTILHRALVAAKKSLDDSNGQRTDTVMAHINVIRVFLSNYKQLGLDQSDNSKQTPLHIAVTDTSNELITILFQHIHTSLKDKLSQYTFYVARVAIETKQFGFLKHLYEQNLINFTTLFDKKYDLLAYAALELRNEDLVQAILEFYPRERLELKYDGVLLHAKAYQLGKKYATCQNIAQLIQNKYQATLPNQKPTIPPTTNQPEKKPTPKKTRIASIEDSSNEIKLDRKIGEKPSKQETQFKGPKDQFGEVESEESKSIQKDLPILLPEGGLENVKSKQTIGATSSSVTILANLTNDPTTYTSAASGEEETNVISTDITATKSFETEKIAKELANELSSAVEELDNLLRESQSPEPKKVSEQEAVTTENQNERTPTTIELEQEIVTFNADEPKDKPRAQSTLFRDTTPLSFLRSLSMSQSQKRSTIVRQRASTDTKDHFESVSKFHEAVMTSNLEQVMNTLRNYRNLNITDIKDQTKVQAVHLAAGHGSYEVLEYLLANKADKTAVDVAAETPLFYALRYRYNSKAIEPSNDFRYLKLLADKSTSNKPNMEGAYPVHIATASCNYKVLEFLLAAGADINARVGERMQNPQEKPSTQYLYKEGDTALHIAMRRGDSNSNDLNVINFLCFSGARYDLKNKENETVLTMKTSSGNNLLHILTFAGNTTLAKNIVRDNPELLLEVNGPGKNNNSSLCLGRNPLHIAAETGNEELARYYVSIIKQQLKEGNNKFSDCLYKKDKEGKTPIALAIASKNFDVYKLLLDSAPVVDPIVDLTDEEENSLIHVAAGLGSTNILKDMLSSRKQAIQKELVPLTKKPVATQTVEEKKKLFNECCKPYSVKTGTPLHLAVMNRQYDTAYSLVEFVKKVTPSYPGLLSDYLDTYVNSMQFEQAVTPLHLACINGDMQLVALLVSNGANITGSLYKKLIEVQLEPEPGLSPLDLAIIHGHIEIAKYLSAFYPNHFDFDNYVRDWRDKNGNNFLHIIANKGNSNALAHVLSIGIDPNLLNNQEQSAIDCALASKDRKAMLKAYKTYLASTDVSQHSNIQNWKKHLNKQDDNGQTYLHRVLNKKKSIIEPTVNIESGENIEQVTVVPERDDPAVEFLVDSGIDVNILDHNGFTALDLAIENEMFSIAEVIASRSTYKGNVHISAIAVYALSSTGKASPEKKIKLLNWLLENRKLQLTALNDQKENLTIIATKANNPEAVKCLLVQAHLYDETVDRQASKEETLSATNRGSMEPKLKISALATLIDYTKEVWQISSGENLSQNQLSSGELNLSQKRLSSNPEQVKKKIQINPPLYHACELADTSVFEILMQAGASMAPLINQGDESVITHKKQTLLDYIVTHPINSRLFELLLNYPSRINEPDFHGNTAIYYAIEQNSQEKVAKLISDNASLNIANNQGETPLHIAAKKGYKQIVELLLNKRHQTIDINKPDNKGNTPLHLAINNGFYELALFLIQNGANLNIENKDGVTPGQLVYKRINDFIINTEANNSTQQIDDNLAELDSLTDQSPLALHYAVNLGIVTKAEALIGDKKELLFSLNTHSKTPLHCAATTNNTGLLKHIINSAGVKSDDLLEMRDDKGNTPLLTAILNNQFDNALVLITNGADLDAENNLKQTPKKLVENLYKMQSFLPKEKRDEKLAELEAKIQSLNRSSLRH